MGEADLVFCGEESSDGATGQVPAGLAEWLGTPQLTLLTQIDLDLDRQVSRGRRELKGGYEILEVPLPTVVSVKTAANEPRFMDYAIKPWAFEPGRVTIWNAADLQADPAYIGLVGSPTVVTGLSEAATRERKRQFLHGSTEDVARQLATLLREVLV
jgi:electron transfer flavoprotein beta subunit